MAYEPEKDVLVADLGTIAVSEKASLSVQVRAYDKGAAKVCLSETGPKQDGTVWRKSLGRFPLEHAVELSELIALAGKHALANGNAKKAKESVK